MYSSNHRLGGYALVGIVAFVLICSAAQLLRTDLDWLKAPLSFYLRGDHGVWVQMAYFALAMAMLGLGFGFYRALQPDARSGAPLLLFVCAAVALCVTALAEGNMPMRPPTLEGFVHGMAAQTAFLCVTTATLLQSLRFRIDARWRRRFALAFSVAVVGFVALWIHAHWRDAPRGLAQKVVIALILGWLTLGAMWLRRPLPDRVKS